MPITILLLGDSFVAGFGGQTAADAGAPEPWLSTTPGATNNTGLGLVTGNGFLSGGTESSAWVDTGLGDNGQARVLMESLYNDGSSPTTYNFAESGGNWNTCSTQFDNAIAQGIVPDVVVIDCGTNPAASLISEATYKPTITALMDKIYSTITPRFVVHHAVCSLSAKTSAPDYTGQPYIDKVDEMNTAIQDVLSNYDRAYYSDVFTATGGQSIILSDWETNGVHPQSGAGLKIGTQSYNTFKIAQSETEDMANYGNYAPTAPTSAGGGNNLLTGIPQADSFTLTETTKFTEFKLRGRGAGADAFCRINLYEYDIPTNQPTNLIYSTDLVTVTNAASDAGMGNYGPTGLDVQVPAGDYTLVVSNDFATDGGGPIRLAEDPTTGANSPRESPGIFDVGGSIPAATWTGTSISSDGYVAWSVGEPVVTTAPTLTTPYSIGNPDPYGAKSYWYTSSTRTASNITSYDFSTEFKDPFKVGDMMWAYLSGEWETLRFISATNVEVL